MLENLQIPHEKICTIAGIGCSSRFPYFVNSHGLHFIHGRALPLATGISLSRPDLHVFAFGGDGDGYSIGGNHLEHAARKNVNLTYVIMDNFVYGLTKKQTSPTSPIGFKSKTDPEGAIDRPINPMKKLVSSGATFVARTHATQVQHMMEMFERAIAHPGFSVVEVLSECVVFYKGAFDTAPPEGRRVRPHRRKEMGQHPRGRGPPRRLRRRCRLCPRRPPVSRQIRRLLRERPSDQEPSSSRDGSTPPARRLAGDRQGTDCPAF